MKSDPNYYIKKEDKNKMKEKEVSKEFNNSEKANFEYRNLITSPLYEGIQRINSISVKTLLKTDDQVIDGEKDGLKSSPSLSIPTPNKKKLANSFEAYRKMMIVKKKV